MDGSGCKTSWGGLQSPGVEVCTASNLNQVEMLKGRRCSAEYAEKSITRDWREQINRYTMVQLQLESAVPPYVSCLSWTACILKKWCSNTDSFSQTATSFSK